MVYTQGWSSNLSPPVRWMAEAQAARTEAAVRGMASGRNSHP